MPMKSSQHILDDYTRWWNGHTRHTGDIHNHFLETRKTGLRQIGSLIKKHVEFSNSPNFSRPHPLFSLVELNEFAAGSIVKCFGPEYAVYEGRRCPRIPNGELLLMSRVVKIQGQKGVFDRASDIAVEFDVPENAWYLSDDCLHSLPYSICIEIALQPCGFLSAYLGTSLRFPGNNYYFRNLDGESVFNQIIDAQGKTISARARLLSTIFYGSTIIQHFTFELECEGVVFFMGKSSFGYFTEEEMASQTGLDGGKPIPPWMNQFGQGAKGIALEENNLDPLIPKGKLHLLDGVVIIRNGGINQEGYLYAFRKNNIQDWFYNCHFLGDPVMPGSLGLEAIFQAMKVFAAHPFHNNMKTEITTGRKMSWSYRGQVLQQHHQMQLEVHFQKTHEMDGKIFYTGDASLWADDSRIYKVQDMSIVTVKRLE